MNKYIIKDCDEKELNGLRVFFNIIGENVEKNCAICKEPGDGVRRQFNIVRVKRGAVDLRLERPIIKKVEVHIRKIFCHGKVLCFNCFEDFLAEENLDFVVVD